MKARLLFREKWSEPLESGKTVTFFMDCYQIDSSERGFARAYKFSWIAFDPNEPEVRVLMDQHGGRPCHIHINHRELPLKGQPENLDEAINLFFSEVQKYFGPIAEVEE